MLHRNHTKKTLEDHISNLIIIVNFQEKLDLENRVEEIFFAGGCLWGVQEFIRHLPGVVSTEAGRANGSTNTTQTEYDGYAECVRTLFLFHESNCFFQW